MENEMEKVIRPNRTHEFGSFGTKPNWKVQSRCQKVCISWDHLQPGWRRPQMCTARIEGPQNQLLYRSALAGLEYQLMRTQPLWRPALTSAIHHQVFISPATVMALRDCGHCHTLCEASRYVVQSVQGTSPVDQGIFWWPEGTEEWADEQHLFLLHLQCNIEMLERHRSRFHGILMGVASISGWTKQMTSGKCQGLEVGNLPFSVFYKANKKDPGFLTQGQPWCQMVKHEETTVL